MAVVNYAPELIEFWKLACRQEIEVELATYKEAFTLRVRLYRLRKDLEKEHHEAWHLAKHAMISLRDSTIIGKPADNQYVDAMKAAGISVAADPVGGTEPTGAVPGAIIIPEGEIVRAPLAMETALASYKDEA